MLVALKPSLRRIGAAILIIATTLIYAALNEKLNKETKNRISEAYLGETYTSKMKEVMSIKCERDEIISGALFELAEKNDEKMQREMYKMLSINVGTLILCAYLSACIIVPRKKQALQNKN